jgi:hypothetical protein
MNRPICQACKSRLCAINYHSDDTVHYRSRCDTCIRKSRKIKSPTPRWKSKGYIKKPKCDRCGFIARYSSQLLVYHLDGNLNNNELLNLKTICLNCSEEVKRLERPWGAGDLEPDL